MVHRSGSGQGRSAYIRRLTAKPAHKNQGYMLKCLVFGFVTPAIGACRLWWAKCERRLRRQHLFAVEHPRPASVLRTPHVRPQGRAMAQPPPEAPAVSHGIIISQRNEHVCCRATISFCVDLNSVGCVHDGLDCVGPAMWANPPPAPAAPQVGEAQWHDAAMSRPWHAPASTQHKTHGKL